MRRARSSATERIIFTGTAAGLTEGPHLYRQDGWYYLVTAEGGTSWEHQVTVARSRNLFGPYEAGSGRPDAHLAPAARSWRCRRPATAAWCRTPDGRVVPGAPGRPGRTRRSALRARPGDRDPGGALDGRRLAADRRAAYRPTRCPAPDLPPHRRLATAAHGRRATTSTSRRSGPDWSTLRRPATPDWVDLDRAPVAPAHLRRTVAGRSAAAQPGRPAGRPPAVQLETVHGVPARPTTASSPASPRYYNTRNWHYAYVTARRRRPAGAGGARPATAADRVDARRLPTSSSPGPTRIGLRVTFDGPGRARSPTTAGRTAGASCRSSWTRPSCPTSTPRAIVRRRAGGVGLHRRVRRAVGAGPGRRRRRTPTSTRRVPPRVRGDTRGRQCAPSRAAERARRPGADARPRHGASRRVPTGAYAVARRVES